MNRWPPETRNRLLFVILVTGSLAALFWFSVIAPLDGRVNTWNNRVDLVRMQLQLAQTSVDRADHYRELVRNNIAEIEALEQRMAQGDYALWVLNELGDLADQFEIELFGFVQPRIGDPNLPPQVPYRLGQFAVQGWAHYHSFGTFLAALENSSPFIKLSSISLASIGPGVPRTEDPEKLSFRIEFHTLANTNPPTASVP